MQSRFKIPTHSLLRMPALISLAAILGGCASSSPLTTTATSLAGSKIGKSCAHYIGIPIHEALMFEVAGNRDIYRAASDAGIASIATVDEERTSYIVYQKRCTVVHGQ